MMTFCPTEADQAAALWMAEAARFLREQGRPASTAEVIEAVRMARMLAQFRDRDEPGDDELLEAAQSVLCGGERTLTGELAAFMFARKTAGEILHDGENLALLEDFLRICKKLRLSISFEPVQVALDLRKPRDLVKSQFFNRLGLLKLDFAVSETGSGRARGTFRENWSLTWSEAARERLELLSKRSLTIADAAETALFRRAGRADSLPGLAELAESAFMADLPAGVETLLSRIEYSAALTADFPSLANALEPLARIARYGSIRQTDPAAAFRTALALCPRLSLALPGACRKLDDHAAGELLPLLSRANSGLLLLEDREALDQWNRALEEVAEQSESHPLLAGNAARQLLGHGTWRPARAGRALERELSPGASPDQAARWLEGFFGSGASSALPHPDLICLINSWLLALSPEAFLHCLPLLRRAFSRLPREGRRQLQQWTRPTSSSSPGSRPAPIRTLPLTMTARLLSRTRQGGIRV